MSDNFSNATFEGKVSSSPVTRKTKTDKNVTTFNLFIKHHSDDGSFPKASCIDVEAWDKLAIMSQEKININMEIMVFGQLRQDRWEGKDGKTKSRIKIIANEIRIQEQKQ